MKNFSGESANTFFCATVDFVDARNISPRNKLRLLTALLNSIDYWLLFAAAQEAVANLKSSHENELAKIYARISSEDALVITIGNANFRLTLESLLMEIIRGDLEELRAIVSAGKLQLNATFSTLNYFEALHAKQAKFLRGDPALFKYAMLAWGKVGAYSADCKTALKDYIEVIRSKPLDSVLLNQKPSRDFGSNSNAMESITKGFKRLGDNNNIRSLRLVKFLQELGDGLPAELKIRATHAKGLKEEPPRQRPPKHNNFENLILFGPPGTGKSFLAKRETGDLKPAIVQFHPSYTYEHFVQGERLIVLGNTRLTQVMDGPLMISYRRCTNTSAPSKALVEHFDKDQKVLIVTIPTGLFYKYGLKDADQIQCRPLGTPGWPKTIRVSENKVLLQGLPLENILPGEVIGVEFRGESWSQMRPEVILIDEINRADVAKVFGELLNAIADKDDFENESTVQLQYSGESFFWPGNLRIIGTMNSADRSIGDIDQALKRRFKIREVSPDSSLLATFKFPELKEIETTVIEGLAKKAGGKAFQELASVAHNSLDDMIGLYNSLGALHGLNADEFFYLHPLSICLDNLNNLISNEEMIFNARKKLIGHSFFISFGRKLARQFAVDLTNGIVDDRSAAIDFSRKVKSEFQAFVKDEIQPQIESICFDQEKLSSRILTDWKDVVPAPSPVQKKATIAKPKAS